MPTALILTPWTTDADGGRYPLLSDLLAGRTGWLWTDLSAQASGRILAANIPNMVAVSLTCDAATLTAIDADARFRVIYDDSSRLASRTLNNSQFTQLRSFLSSRLGFTTAQMDAAIGTSHGGRTVAQIVNALIAWIRTA